MGNFISTLSIVVSSALIYAAPLIFTALGGTFSERSGIVNVGLEGIMVMGAFSSIVFNLSMGDVFGNWTPWVGLLVGGGIGLIFSLIHAVATVNLRANHIVSGTVINMLAPALAIFLTRVLYEGRGQTDFIKFNFGKSNIPLLEHIPILGDIFFKGTSAAAFVAILIAVLAWYILFKSRFGLRLRSVGEHPQAADTLGINVYLMRYAGVMISGFLGGIGGAVAAQSISLNFSVSTIAGQGFIALAAMIFGKWNPLGAMGAAIFFGFAQSLSVIGSYIPIIKDVPPVALQISPYILTIIVLVAFIGKSQGPAANGETYIKSK
ncbi:sugar ABC transporter permease [Carnobacterium maltaromaticum]|uniref:ABC transporter permease n=1 Tax=Carnobacterium maltaromaticum TaxID=2751 RepID=UPI000C76804E|nr:ABC transporter permease [Carnobacterium maltaromaticum]PLS36957.1 sugar ABC transporter permease [Carnobacterium maltaromaticum]PLS46501.1 sugar ABC transporter permease [Carnobacterium maltaromaticum]PLS53008.1 sugar ABC transporter permease [Carnobacterium maltaromaticum]PLS56906.1 sugar ABC transporter permease [Carnobacterium maltaromaticum]PLS57378.1 sugar ABC transporter permease [Carnobacterium maltaromaticum]